MIMDGSKLVLIVVPVVIPLVLAVGVALPLIADRDNGRAFSSSRVATSRPGNSHSSFTRGPRGLQGAPQQVDQRSGPEPDISPENFMTFNPGSALA